MSSLGNKEIMAKNIQHFMGVTGKTRNDICKDLGFSYTTFTDWVKGNTYPRIDKIEIMANYFGITKADLIEEMPTPISESRHSSSLDARLNELLAQATEETKQAMIVLLEQSRKP